MNRGRRGGRGRQGPGLPARRGRQAFWRGLCIGILCPSQPKLHRLSWDPSLHVVASAKGYVRERGNPSRILTKRAFFKRTGKAAPFTVFEMRAGTGLRVRRQGARPHPSVRPVPRPQHGGLHRGLGAGARLERGVAGTSPPPQAGPAWGTLPFFSCLEDFWKTPSRPSLTEFLSFDTLQMSFEDVICPDERKLGCQEGNPGVRRWGDKPGGWPVRTPPCSACAVTCQL